MTKTINFDQQDYSITATVGNQVLKFTKLKLPNVHVVDGNEFPLAFEIDNEDHKINRETFEQFFSEFAKSGYYGDLLTKHGAILFRGLGYSAPSDFSLFVNAVENGRQRVPFEQIGLFGIRNEKALNVFTASDTHQLRKLHQHSEYARYTHFPGNIHFFAQSVSQAEGGATPIAHQRELFSKVLERYPEVIKEFSAKGMQQTSTFIAKRNEDVSQFYNWEHEDVLGREIDQHNDSFEVKRAKAEKQIKRLTDEFEWLENNDVKVTQKTPAFRVHPETGKPVWFNSVTTSAGPIFDVNPQDEAKGIKKDTTNFRSTLYADGSVIDLDTLEKIHEISVETQFVHTWQDSDLLLVDNYQVSHGRHPWLSGERIVLVSLWDEPYGTPKPSPWYYNEQQ